MRVCERGLGRAIVCANETRISAKHWIRKVRLYSSEMSREGLMFANGKSDTEKVLSGLQTPTPAGGTLLKDEE